MVSPGAAMEFRVLGPLEIGDDATAVEVRAGKQRALLAVLLCHANQPVSTDRLIDALWGATPPKAAAENLRLYVYHLRRALGADERIVRRPTGYALVVGADELDALRFEALADEGETALALGDHARAVEALRSALSLWRGPAYADLDRVDAVAAEADRLDARRDAVREARIDAELALGRHDTVLTELTQWVRQQPLRERLRAQLMVALYRCGRQAEALQVYQDARHLLATELGIEPGPELRRLERAILAADPALDLPRAEPPDTRRPVPASLPADMPGFTGRTDQLAELDRLAVPVGGPPAVLITGTAGVGKTALAVHWAYRTRDRFPDGQLYLNLGGYSARPPVRPLEALAYFLRLLGVGGEQVPSDVEQAAGLLRTTLTGRRVLIMLDNARGVDQVRPLLPGAAGCVALVTSRDRLTGLVARDGAARLPLDVLSADEAESLLTAVLGERLTGADPAATAALARACGYLPLALRITAANLAEHPGRGVAAHVAELRDGDQLGGLAVAGDRETAVRAAFDLSYAGLDGPARRLFRRFGLVPGPDVTLAGAARLADHPEPDTARLLDRLTAAHLLAQPTPGRFATHDLVRIYAAERGRREDPDADRAATVDRLYDHYLRRADAAARALYPTTLRLPLPESTPSGTEPDFADHRAALDWLDAERQNLLAAVVRAADHGPRPAAWLLADVLRGYFWLRMDTIAWRTAASAGLRAAEAEGDPRAQAAAELSLADMSSRCGDYPDAIAHGERSLALGRQAGWAHGQAAALGTLGNVHWRLGRITRSAEYQAAALALNRAADRPAGQAVNLANLANAYRELGRLAAAADQETQALALYRRLGSRNGEAATLGNLGETLHELGRFDAARDHLTRALTLHRQVGDRGVEAESMARLAAVERDAGRPERALELAREALRLITEVGEDRYEADALNVLASVECVLGRYPAAVEHHDRALTLSRAAGSRYPVVVALTGLAAAHLGRGDPATAWAYARDAAEGAERTGYQLLAGRARTVAAAAVLALDRPADAVDEGQRALASHRATGHRLGEAETLVVLGHAYARLGSPGAARQAWRAALDRFTVLGSPRTGPVRDLLQSQPA